MTIDRARELIQVQMGGGGYNRNAVRMILSEVHHFHGQGAVDQLIREFGLDQQYGLKVGTDFSSLRSRS